MKFFRILKLRQILMQILVLGLLFITSRSYDNIVVNGKFDSQAFQGVVKQFADGELTGWHERTQKSIQVGHGNHYNPGLHYGRMACQIKPIENYGVFQEVTTPTTGIYFLRLKWCPSIGSAEYGRFDVYWGNRLIRRLQSPDQECYIIRERVDGQRGTTYKLEFMYYGPVPAQGSKGAVIWNVQLFKIKDIDSQRPEIHVNIKNNQFQLPQFTNPQSTHEDFSLVPDWKQHADKKVQIGLGSFYNSAWGRTRRVYQMVNGHNESTSISQQIQTELLTHYKLIVKVAATVGFVQNATGQVLWNGQIVGHLHAMREHFVDTFRFYVRSGMSRKNKLELRADGVNPAGKGLTIGEISLIQTDDHQNQHRTNEFLHDFNRIQNGRFQYPPLHGQPRKRFGRFEVKPWVGRFLVEIGKGFSYNHNWGPQRIVAQLYSNNLKNEEYRQTVYLDPSKTYSFSFLWASHCHKQKKQLSAIVTVGHKFFVRIKDSDKTCRIFKEEFKFKPRATQNEVGFRGRGAHSGSAHLGITFTDVQIFQVAEAELQPGQIKKVHHKLPVNQNPVLLQVHHQDAGGLRRRFTGKAKYTRL